MAGAKRQKKTNKKPAVKVQKDAFKKSLGSKNHADIEMVEEFFEQMDTTETSKPVVEKTKTNQNTKKRLQRKKRKEELRNFVKSKAKKIQQKAGTLMEDESKADEKEVQTPKVNETRTRAADLPLVITARSKKEKHAVKTELSKHVVSARKLSKKKAKKLLKAQKFALKDKEAKEALKAAMEQ